MKFSDVCIDCKKEYETFHNLKRSPYKMTEKRKKQMMNLCKKCALDDCELYRRFLKLDPNGRHTKMLERDCRKHLLLAEKLLKDS